MNRRHFLAASCTASLAAMSNTTIANQGDKRDFYELKQYILDSEEQKKRIDTFLRDTAIPAYNRFGINPVGVFQPTDGFSPIYLLLRYNSLETFATITQSLLADSDFMSKGKDVLDTPSSNPAYRRIESRLMAAFEQMPKLEIPTKAETRIFQLRTYESHSVKAGQKKIEMFNKGEIDIFRKTGLNPVFFGESLAGTLIPNLTYMLAFDDRNQSDTNWGIFIRDPQWKEISAIPEYSDRLIVSNITNIYLRPASYSQI
jgi:hypothetical protein